MFKKGLLLLYILVFVAVLYTIFNGELVQPILSEPLNLYSVLLFFLALIFSLISVFKTTALPPSVLLLPLFLIAPIIGSWGYQDFLEIHGNFFGRGEISFVYPTFVWAVGTAVFYMGALLSHFFWPQNKRDYIVLWDYKRISFLLWITLILSLIFSIVAMVKIGHIPILSSNILDERGAYPNIVGHYTYRFSTMWVVAGSLSSMLFFLEKNKKTYLFVTLLCVLGMIIYGQRRPGVIVIISFILMYFKFHRPKTSHLLLMAASVLILIFVFVISAEIRAGNDPTKLPLSQLISRGVFNEWQYYAVVVDETKSNSDYLGYKIFLGQFATLLPRQLFSSFGINKELIIKKYTAAYYYGEEFNHPYGIRITPIGEAYAGYGMAGVVFQLFLFGLCFGALDKIYLGLKKQDARICFVSFLLSLIMYLPIGMIYMILAPITREGLFLLVYLFVGTKRYPVKLTEGSKLRKFAF